MSEIEIVTTGTDEIVAYSPVLAQLAEIKKGNASIVFDYEDKKDNARARSYVHQLRKLKALTDKERKAAKAESLAYGRRVDAEAKRITGEIVEMINVHAVPLAKIEQREKDRIENIQNTIETMKMLPDSDEAMSFDYAAAIQKLKSVKIDKEFFEEFTIEAAEAKDATLAIIEGLQAKAEKNEAEQVELKRLRKEAEDRAQKDRDENIRRIAKERAETKAEEARKQAKADAEAAAKKQAEDAEKRELNLKLEREKAEREKAEAIARAERIERETEERIKKEAEQKRLKEEADAEARSQDKKRKALVNSEILEALKSHGLKEAGIELLIGLVADNKIPHMTINY